MGRVNLPALVAEVSPHPLAQRTCPVRSTLRHDAYIQTDSRIDVPEAEHRDDQRDPDNAREKEGRIQVHRLLVNLGHPVRPPENVVSPEEQDQQQQNESNWKERDVSFEK